MPVVSRCRCVSKSAQPRDLSDRNREKTTNASSNTIATPWLQRILLLFLSFEIRAFREMTARCFLFLFLSADTYSRCSSTNGKFSETAAWSRSDSAVRLVTGFPARRKGNWNQQSWRKISYYLSRWRNSFRSSRIRLVNKNWLSASVTGHRTNIFRFRFRFF